MSQPYTLSFGSWSPDLQNVGVQLGFQYSATAVPCSDVLNVYYADGAFRSIPSPAATGPSLGIPVTNASNWYDDSTGKEIVFGGTANGLYMLEDGTWSQVPIQLNASATAIGTLLQLSLGVPYYFVFSPSSQSKSGTSASFTFPAETVGSAPAGATYAWSVSGASGGTWSVGSGQGTASSAAAVSAVSAGTTASCTYNVAVTVNGTPYDFSASLSYGYMTGAVSGNAVGQGTTNSVTASASAGVTPLTYAWSTPAHVTANSPSSATTTFSASTASSGSATCTITDINGTQVFPACIVTIYTYDGSITSGSSGSQIGYAMGSFGSITPTSDLNSNVIAELVFDGSDGELTLSIFSGASLGQSYFGTLMVAANSFTSSAATYLYNGGKSEWSWAVTNPLAGTQDWSFA